MLIKRKGFGQLEPNHLSAQRNGQIYAQLKAKSNITQLEQGQFVKYDYANGEVNFTGPGEWMLVFNEIENYGTLPFEQDSDFALQSKNFDNREITPRVLKTMIGDILTTNTLGAANTQFGETEGVTLAEKDYVAPSATGFLDKVADANGEMVWQVVKVYTVPDGQPGVKLMRIK